jgi:hypothetical protein
MKYILYKNLFESKVEISKKDDYLIFKLNNSFCKVYFNNDLISENLPTWATKEAYLVFIDNKGEKGNGKIIINEIITKLKNIGADILTLRVDNGIGFLGKSYNKLYEYYKSLGFKSFSENEYDGAMYMDLR